MKKNLLKRLGLLLAMLTIVTASFAQDPNTTKKPLLTIGCLSDMHNELSLINPASGKAEDVKLRGTILNTLKGMFENEDLDLIVLGGDCSSDVTIPKANWERLRDLMHEAFRSAFRPERTRRPVIYTTGNHDYEVANFDNIPKSYNAADYLPIMEEDIYKLPDSEKFYEEADNGSLGKMKLLAAFHYVINGFDFVMLNCGKNFFKSAWDYNYSFESIEWVNQKLDEIYAENPDKTVFFVLHLPFGDSNSISAYSKGLDCNNTSNSAYKLKQALAKHPNLIMLYGHDHGTNSAFIRAKTSQRVTRYDSKGNVISQFDDTHFDFLNGEPDPDEGSTAVKYYIQSVPTSQYLWYDSSNNLETTTAKKYCTVTSDAGSFTIDPDGSHLVHIGSSGRFSGGSASAILLYRVEDTLAPTYTATKATTIEKGATYLITAVYSSDGKTYALSNQLYSADSGNGQRMQSTAVTVSGNSVSVKADENLLWTFSEVEEEEEPEEPGGTTDLTKGTFALKNEGNGKYLNIDPCNLGTTAEPGAWLFAYDGGFSMSQGSYNVYIGTAGRFSRNKDYKQVFELFRVDDLDATTMTATKVTKFDLGGHYLIVGTKDNVKYALSWKLYNGGVTEDQRMESVKVTVSNNTISMAMNKDLIWTVEEMPEVETGDSSFFSAFMGSMRYYNNSIEGDVSVTNSKIVQAMMVYIYDDHVFLEVKNYGEYGTFNGITIREKLIPYVVNRKVVRSHTTGLDTHINQVSTKNGIFDLQGRRVNQARHGVFIVDNHKVMVK